VLRRSATGGEHQSFHNRLRDECLNQEVFLSVTEAREDTRQLVGVLRRSDIIRAYIQASAENPFAK
jgi:hypothetical protein